MAYFSFNGTTSLSQGVVVLDYPPIIRAAARVETVEIPGRSGVLTLHNPLKTYNTIEKTFRCRLLSTASQIAVSAWLQGAGTLIVGNEPTYAYTVVDVNEITFEKIMPGYADRVFEVTFVCQPWKELAVPGEDITLTTNPQTITSVATMDSLPQIILTGTGTVKLEVGTYAIQLTGMNNAIPVLIDCEAMTVTNVAMSISYISSMTGSFPKLVTGDNVIQSTGTVASVVIKPRYRWL
jgi:phage-related protein